MRLLVLSAIHGSALDSERQPSWPLVSALLAAAMPKPLTFECQRVLATASKLMADLIITSLFGDDLSSPCHTSVLRYGEKGEHGLTV